MNDELQQLKDELGACSWDMLARRLARETDYKINVAGNTVRRWFLENRIPLREHFLLIEMAELPRKVILETHLWLDDYVGIIPAWYEEDVLKFSEERS